MQYLMEMAPILLLKDLYISYMKNINFITFRSVIWMMI